MFEELLFSMSPSKLLSEEVTTSFPWVSNSILFNSRESYDLHLTRLYWALIFNLFAKYVSGIHCLRCFLGSHERIGYLVLYHKIQQLLEYSDVLTITQRSNWVWAIAFCLWLQGNEAKEGGPGILHYVLHWVQLNPWKLLYVSEINYVGSVTITAKRSRNNCSKRKNNQFMESLRKNRSNFNAIQKDIPAYSSWWDISSTYRKGCSIALM